MLKKKYYHACNMSTKNNGGNTIKCLSELKNSFEVNSTFMFHDDVSYYVWNDIYDITFRGVQKLVRIKK